MTSTAHQESASSASASPASEAQAQAAKAKKETQYTTVKMDDDRIVEFAGKRKMLKTSLFNEDGTIAVRLDFVNGETRTFTVPEPLLAKCAAHGAEQKLGDEIAGLDDVEDCIMAIDELMTRLEAGEWSVKKESNGMAGTSVLARALVEHSGKPMADVRAFLSKKSQAEKVALRQNAAIAPIVARLESEKTKKASTVDTGKLLGELAGPAEGQAEGQGEGEVEQAAV